MMKRREFITLLGGAAPWPLAVRAQRRVIPVIGVINGGSPDVNTRRLSAFRAALATSGYVEGENISVEYHWLEGRSDQIPAVVADLVQRRVAVIATPLSVAAARAAKAATTSIPVVFGVNDDPIRLGLVTSFARPGGNLTGMNYFSQQAVPKRLGLLHELVPKASRVTVLINPATAASETALREAQDTGRAIGLRIEILNASTSRAIEAAFGDMASARTEALFIVGDSYFATRYLQIATLAARYGIAASAPGGSFVEVGGLMSYGTDPTEVWQQVGAYAGQILNGAKPADLPVVQSTRFEFVINLPTARALGINVPPTLIATADRVIE